MFDVLDRQTRLTANQKKIIAAAMLGDALEFFDYFLIGYVLAFLIEPWKLTLGVSAVVLLSSGVGAIIGALSVGLDCRPHRPARGVHCHGTELLDRHRSALFHAGQWLGLPYRHALLRGPGRGRLYCVDLPLVQEFMPTSKRGWVGGLVTAVIPLGVGLGGLLGAFIGPSDWRLLFLIGLLPASMVLLVRLWVPESPRWLARQGQLEEARRSLAWALQVDAASLPLPRREENSVVKTSWFDLFKHPRSLLVSWLGSLGHQTGIYGVLLWAPSLFVLILKVSPQEAAKMMILLSVLDFIGRLTFSWLSESIGRRRSGGLLGFGAGLLVILAGYQYEGTIFGLSALWLILAVAVFFAGGGWAAVGPYSAEIWPSHLKTTGMGSAYGFGGIGKITGPWALALILGSDNYLKPDVPLTEIPTFFLYLGCWFLMAGVVYYFFGLETRGKTFEEIDRELAAAK